jgi:hypothetical protein
LLDLGWTIENYMKGCFNLWYNYTQETEDFGTVQQWSKIITTHPHNRRILVNDKNELIQKLNSMLCMEELIWLCQSI